MTTEAVETCGHANAWGLVCRHDRRAHVPALTALTGPVECFRCARSRFGTANGQDAGDAMHEFEPEGAEEATP